MATSTSVQTSGYDPYALDIPVLVRLFITGLLVGALGWLLYMAISQFFVVPVFCRNADAFSACANGGTISWVAAHIIVLAAAVAALARMSVYRPLLIALAAFAALWGAQAWLGGLSWYEAVAWQALLFGVAFAVFGWIARMLNFVVALIVMIVLVVAARFVLTLA